MPWTWCLSGYFQPHPLPELLASLSNCLADIPTWMSPRHLNLTMNETRLSISSHQILPQTHPHFSGIAISQTQILGSFDFSILLPPEEDSPGSSWSLNFQIIRSHGAPRGTSFLCSVFHFSHRGPTNCVKFPVPQNLDLPLHPTSCSISETNYVNQTTLDAVDCCSLSHLILCPEYHSDLLMLPQPPYSLLLFSILHQNHLLWLYKC